MRQLLTLHVDRQFKSGTPAVQGGRLEQQLRLNFLSLGLSSQTMSLEKPSCRWKLWLSSDTTFNIVWCLKELRWGNSDSPSVSKLCWQMNHNTGYTKLPFDDDCVFSLLVTIITQPPDRTSNRFHLHCRLQLLRVGSLQEIIIMQRFQSCYFPSFWQPDLALATAQVLDRVWTSQACTPYYSVTLMITQYDIDLAPVTKY